MLLNVHLVIMRSSNWYRTHSGTSDPNSHSAAPATTGRAPRYVCKHFVIQPTNVPGSKKKIRPTQSKSEPRPCTVCSEVCHNAKQKHNGCGWATAKCLYGNNVPCTVDRDPDGQFRCPTCNQAWFNGESLKVSVKNIYSHPLTATTEAHLDPPTRDYTEHAPYCASRCAPYCASRCALDCGPCSAPSPPIGSCRLVSNMSQADSLQSAFSRQHIPLCHRTCEHVPLTHGLDGKPCYTTSEPSVSRPRYTPVNNI